MRRRPARMPAVLDLDVTRFRKRLLHDQRVDAACVTAVLEDLALDEFRRFFLACDNIIGARWILGSSHRSCRRSTQECGGREFALGPHELAHRREHPHAAGRMTVHGDSTLVDRKFALGDQLVVSIHRVHVGREHDHGMLVRRELGESTAHALSRRAVLAAVIDDQQGISFFWIKAIRHEQMKFRDLTRFMLLEITLLRRLTFAFVPYGHRSLTGRFAGPGRNVDLGVEQRFVMRHRSRGGQSRDNTDNGCKCESHPVSM